MISRFFASIDPINCRKNEYRIALHNYRYGPLSTVRTLVGIMIRRISSSIPLVVDIQDNPVLSFTLNS